MNISDYDDEQLRGSSFEALAIPPKSPLWIADLIFYRQNRSVKYGQNGLVVIPIYFR